MVAKINIGSNLYGALAYNQEKVDEGLGKVIGSRLVFGPADGAFSVSECMNDFMRFVPAHFRTEKPVFHVSINPHPNDRNAEGNTDPDHGISMGLFSYPVLMAADILMFNATHIPVGRDQIQHVEMARDIAGRFNHRYRELFVMPEAVVDDNVALLTGLDGRKMSKSYGNIIALFDDEKSLRKQIMKIVTNSQAPGEPKDPEDSTIFDIYRAFASEDEQAEMRKRYAEGIGWGDAKQMLFERINAELAAPREKYHALIAEPHKVEEILLAGAEKARAQSRAFLAQVREAVGIRRLGR